MILNGQFLLEINTFTIDATDPDLQDPPSVTDGLFNGFDRDAAGNLKVVTQDDQRPAVASGC